MIALVIFVAFALFKATTALVVVVAFQAFVAVIVNILFAHVTVTIVALVDISHQMAHKQKLDKIIHSEKNSLFSASIETLKTFFFISSF